MFSNSKKKILNKWAVTLIELVVAIIIIGILAGIALPMFARTYEHARAREAVAALQAIRTGQRVYRSEEGFYFPSDGGLRNVDDIEDNLIRMEYSLDERNWTYWINAGATQNAFQAEARRIGGPNKGKTITIDQNGDFGGDWPLPIPPAP
jgi:prepilin-type N-terminal cleavage/methylation domain-containing protein